MPFKITLNLANGTKVSRQIISESIHEAYKKALKLKNNINNTTVEVVRL